MNNKKDVYYNYFQKNILPAIMPFEQERTRTVRNVVITSALCFVVGVGFAVLFIMNALYNWFNPLIFPILLFLMYAFIIKSIINVIVAGKEYEKRLVKTILPLFFEPIANFKRWPEKDLTTILDSQLFSNFEDIEENLCIFGFYNNTSVRISDTRLALPVKSSEKSYLFKGTMIKLELPSSINNHVIMQSKNQTKVNHFKQINPHIEDLNRFLYCFAKKSDNISFINEDFWTLIKKFGELYTAKSFSLSYNNNVLLIALKQKKPMQFGFLFKSLLKAKNYDELIERFTIVFDLIDLLNS